MVGCAAEKDAAGDEVGLRFEACCTLVLFGYFDVRPLQDFFVGKGIHGEPAVLDFIITCGALRLVELLALELGKVSFEVGWTMADLKLAGAPTWC